MRELFNGLGKKNLEDLEARYKKIVFLLEKPLHQRDILAALAESRHCRV